MDGLEEKLREYIKELLEKENSKHPYVEEENRKYGAFYAADFVTRVGLISIETYIGLLEEFALI